MPSSVKSSSNKSTVNLAKHKEISESNAVNKALSKENKISEDQIQKTKQDFLKIIAATLKYQSPDKPADPGQIAQTMASIQQTEEAIRTRRSIDELKESFSWVLYFML